MPKEREALLFVPGHRQSMVYKETIFEADTVIFDLEDAVPLEEKAAAREIVRQALADHAQRDVERAVRVNAADTPYFEGDLQAVVGTGLDVVLVPKAEDPGMVRKVSGMLTDLEERAGLPRGRISLILLLETAAGILRAAELATASDRVVALAFGAEDFAASTGVSRSESMEFPRWQVVLAAAAAGIQAIDTVYVDFRDHAGLEAEVRRIRSLGFTGKLCIHPSQIQVVRAAFAPDPEEVAWAQRVTQAFEAALQEGLGAVAVDGKMIDRPVVERARRVLRQAAARGMEVGG